MKEGISGGAVNELDVSDYFEEQKRLAKELLLKLKSKEKECPKIIIKQNSYTIKSEGFDGLMFRRTKIKRIFKRNTE